MYPGEHGPEALEIADEYCVEENPEWIEGKLRQHRGDKSFESVQILRVNVSDAAIEAALFPPEPEVVAELA